MNEALKTLLTRMHRHCMIGGKHTPEKSFIMRLLKRLPRDEQKEFFREYRQLFDDDILIREKKRTGKGYDWHISINPRRAHDVKELLKGEGNETI
ncbi:hypothetical protein JW711_02250 [Candidatus Woesearchaeota archaeon]|nr:hypothetical protein [Candidatus Woesearchaeota archaeon]